MFKPLANYFKASLPDFILIGFKFNENYSPVRAEISIQMLSFLFFVNLKKILFLFSSYRLFRFMSN